MIPVTPQPNRSTGPHVYVPGAPDRAARRLVMAHALADLTFAFLLLALAAAGQPQPQRSLESLNPPDGCALAGTGASPDTAGLHHRSASARSARPGGQVRHGATDYSGPADRRGRTARAGRDSSVSSRSYREPKPSAHESYGNTLNSIRVPSRRPR